MERGREERYAFTRGLKLLLFVQRDRGVVRYKTVKGCKMTLLAGRGVDFIGMGWMSLACQ